MSVAPLSDTKPATSQSGVTDAVVIAPEPVAGRSARGRAALFPHLLLRTFFRTPQGPLLLWPLGGMLLLFVISYGAGVDFWLASFWYQLQGGRWALQQHWLTEGGLHQGARTLNQWLVGLLLAYYGLRSMQHVYPRCRVLRKIAQRWPAAQPWSAAERQAYGRLIGSLALSLAGVALVKQSVAMDCPWDLVTFGGHQPFTGLFSPWPADRAPNACFPAGHASNGYAWFGLYFFLRARQSTVARPALWLVVLVALVLGLAQQLRGAHFLSHDIATAAWCWTVACLCAGRASFTAPQQTAVACTTQETQG